MTINSNAEAIAPKYRDIAEIFKVQLTNAHKLPEIIYIDESQFEKNKQKDAYVILISKNQDLNNIDLPFNDEEKNLLKELMSSESFIGENEKIIRTILKINGKFSHIILAGIGETDKINLLKIETLGKKISNQLHSVKIKNILVSYNVANLDHDMAASLSYAFLVNHFKFTLKNNFKKPEDREQDHLISTTIVVNKNNIPALNKYLEETKSLIKAKNISKAYCNGSGNLIYPESFANFVKEDLSKLGLKVTVLETKEMKELGMGALLGVAMASDFPPRFIVIEWNGGNKADAPLAFVGKGVTFDSGGLSIKPGDSMESMKYDMSGAATVAGVMRVLAERKAKVNVVGVMGIVENAISGNAQRPDDVVLSMSGQTIEVLNTDAEGRLILADALTYVQQKHNPIVIVDLATLTGACIAALGNNIYAGLMSNNDELASKLLEESRKTGERLWRLPLDEEYNKAMDSKIADMQNIGKKGFGAGTTTAAEFLQRFIDDGRAWAHLDIAGVDNHKSGDEAILHGSTGFGIRLLNEFSKRYEH